MKKILIIGNGGRENCIIQSLYKSPQEIEIYNLGSSINPDIKKFAKKIFIGDIMDNNWLAEVSQKIAPDFAIIGPDDPIGNGATDALEKINIPCFSPNKECAQLESSKSFTRNLLAKYKIEGSPDFFISTEINNTKSREKFYQKHQGKIVLKADGLLGGKGVIVANDHFSNFKKTEDFSKKSINKFGKVVLEEKLIGQEFSIIFFTDGKTIAQTPIIQDHKRAFEDDKGPNTGGMGTISNAQNSLDFLEEKDLQCAKEMTEKVLEALKKETKKDFIGLMYGGFMKTEDNKIKLIEYNARFGDPEVYNILGIMKNDFIEVVEKCLNQELHTINMEFEKIATIVKYLCPNGYPENPIKNAEIKIPSSASHFDSTKAEFYLASIKSENEKLLLGGSRAIAVLGKGQDYEEARINCEKLIEHFQGPLFFRKDIGTKEYIQKKWGEFC